MSKPDDKDKPSVPTVDVIGSRRAFIAAILTVILIWGLVGFALYDSFRSTEELAKQASAGVEALINQDISRNIEILDLSLQAVIDGYQSPEVMALPPPLRQETLFDRSATAEGLGAILVIDKTGKVVLDSRTLQLPSANLADREYFQIQKNSSEAGLYVSRPLQSRISQNSWMIALSRRISDQNGGFAGVVVCAIRLSYFEHVLAKALWVENAAIALTDVQGDLLARYPPIPALTGQNLPFHGLLLAITQASDNSLIRLRDVDGVYRIYSSRRMERLPIVMSAGVPVQTLFAGWKRRSSIIVVCLATLSALILSLAARIDREIARRRRFEAKLVALARTDELTGVANRRHFDELFYSEWARATRDSSMIGLLMIDVDFFKSFNDRLGHQAGDDALAAIATCLKAQVKRPADIIARYGGEEFAVILPDTDERGAMSVAEKMRTAIEGLELATTFLMPSKLTISVGSAAMRASRHDGAELIAEADRALYSAKSSGRNRVCGTPAICDPLRLSA